MAYITDTGDACDITTWSNLVNIVAGVNKMTGHSCELDTTSSEADITSNNGYSWTYAENGTFRCGFHMPITVSCLTPNTPTTTIAYYDYETPRSGVDSDCLGRPINRTDYPGNPKTTKQLI